MKKIIYTTLFCLSVHFASAQVALGGKTSVEGNNTILDFNNIAGNTRGIILSAVESAPTSLNSANNGTFLFDRTDKKVKMYEKNMWVDLSDEGTITTALIANTNTTPEKDGSVIIGAESSSAKGVLILQSPNKAMILPKIENPHTNVKSPYPGMICYDTASKSLAVFDGSVWNYWR